MFTCGSLIIPVKVGIDSCFRINGTQTNKLQICYSNKQLVQITLYAFHSVPVGHRTLKVTIIIHLCDVCGICISILIMELSFGFGFDRVDSQTNKLNKDTYSTVKILTGLEFGNIYYQTNRLQ